MARCGGRSSPSRTSQGLARRRCSSRRQAGLSRGCRARCRHGPGARSISFRSGRSWRPRFPASNKTNGRAVGRGMNGIAARLGLNRPELRAWVLYDFANSAFQTTVIAAVFPIYFQRVAAADLPASVATSRYAWATTIAICIVAIVAPILGALADTRKLKKPLLAIFMGLGVGATAAMYGIQEGDWKLALVLFVIGN